MFLTGLNPGVVAILAETGRSVSSFPAEFSKALMEGKVSQGAKVVNFMSIPRSWWKKAENYKIHTFSDIKLTVEEQCSM